MVEIAGGGLTGQFSPPKPHLLDAEGPPPGPGNSSSPSILTRSATRCRLRRMAQSSKKTGAAAGARRQVAKNGTNEGLQISDALLAEIKRFKKTLGIPVLRPFVLRKPG